MQNFDIITLLFTLHSLQGLIPLEGLSLLPRSVQSNKWLPTLVNGQEEPQAFNQFQSSLLQIFYQELIPITNNGVKIERTVLPSPGKLQSSTALHFQGMGDFASPEAHRDQRVKKRH